jgi:hypothetical protein
VPLWRGYARHARFEGLEPPPGASGVYGPA